MGTTTVETDSKRYNIVKIMLVIIKEMLDIRKKEIQLRIIIYLNSSEQQMFVTLDLTQLTSTIHVNPLPVQDKTNLPKYNGI